MEFSSYICIKFSYSSLFSVYFLDILCLIILHNLLHFRYAALKYKRHYIPPLYLLIYIIGILILHEPPWASSQYETGIKKLSNKITYLPSLLCGDICVRMLFMKIIYHTSLQHVILPMKISYNKSLQCVINRRMLFLKTNYLIYLQVGFRYQNDFHENKLPYISQTCSIGIKRFSMHLFIV